jgi:ABC-type multidrug transport system ATPase subunit
VHRSQSNKTLVNDRPLSGATAVRAGDRIRLGYTGPAVEILSTDTHSAPPSETQSAPHSVVGLLHGVGAERFDITRGGTIGRDGMRTQFCLDHPHVSRVHAAIDIKDQELILRDLGSANGTFVNGQRLVGRHVLTPGDRVDISPFTLVFDGRFLASRSRANNVELAVSGVGRVLPATEPTRQLTLLDNIALVVHPGEFLCILGPSGSGKSTLLGIISGRQLPSTGTVAVNGQDLHANFAALKEDIAAVPQTAALHVSLTVEQMLRFTAALRLPPDLDAAEVQAAVDDILRTVGLDQHRTTRIGHLSGGQIKRAGLANELLAQPSLIFLDEVTSGLDEQADGEMMRLFRGLADSGKTVICVTHNLAHVEENAHLVAVLAVGGRLAFLGSPQEAKLYLRVTRLPDVYAELSTRPAQEWATAFLQSPAYERYIDGRLSASNRVFRAGPSERTDRPKQSWFRQTAVLIARSGTIWRGDLPSLGALFGQAALVTILLCIVFGDVERIDTGSARQVSIRNLLLLTAVSCFWLGCNNSVKEIVKERLIYHRERHFNLLPESYFAAKFFVMAAVGLAQTAVLGGVVFAWCNVPGSIAQGLLVLGLLSLAGTAFGLAVSAMASSEELAVALVPIAVIPQIILAGVVAELARIPEWFARLFITVYWGQKALEASLSDTMAPLSQFQPAIAECGVVLSMHVVTLSLVGWYATRWLNSTCA